MGGGPLHIVDGILSPPVLAAGAALSAAGLAYGLKRMDADDVPRVALMSAAFFVASLIHVPAGPVSVHLMLPGLIGVILGWTSFPAIAVALVLQAAFFGFGGILSFGVNLLCLGGPAVCMWYLCRHGLRHGGRRWASVWGFTAGALGIAGAAALAGASLALSSDAFLPAAGLVLIAHVPVMVVEGFVVAAAALFLVQVKPEVFSPVLYRS